METKESVVVAEGKEYDAKNDGKDDDEDRKMLMDMELIRDNFITGPNGEIPLQSFINAFSEMNNFFKILGPLFHFIANDIERKVKRLTALVEGDSRQHYVDVKTMLDYELDNGLVDMERVSSPCGAKCFRSLHRSLDFLNEFLKDCLKEEEEPSLGQASSTIYKETFACFHPPILATAIGGVLLLLPKRATVWNKLSKENKEIEKKLKNLVPEWMKAMKEVNIAGKRLYKDRNLL